jgi:peptidoglycan/xylan/chitin deacetylase (PgdA/CDA1 family)
VLIRLSCMSALALCVLASPLRAAERPPQFVAISFDNCGELERWRELSAFLESAGPKINFTFFVSGTNFLPDAKRHRYRAPGQGPGQSNIGFGGSAESVRERIALMTHMRARGDEIASHAVGHFDGRLWTAAQWSEEFQSYRELMTAAADGADSVSPAGIVGFRAPYLGRAPALYAALKSNGFRYDASGVGMPGDWPQKVDGVWRFNLAQLKIAGSGRPTLSMDYNFLVAQSGPAGNPRLQDVFGQQMLRTYLDYFQKNYAGNRAPIHIGHHFSPMQGGAYQRALLTFARSVCDLPEVRCVNYTTLADFLDKVGPETLTAWQRGDFPRDGEPSSDLARAPLRGAL